MNYHYEVVPDDCMCTWYTQDAGGGSAGLFLEWADHMPTPPDLKEAF